MRYLVSLHELEPPPSDWYATVLTRRVSLQEAVSASPSVIAGISADGRAAFLLLDTDDDPAARIAEVLGLAAEGWGIRIQAFDPAEASARLEMS
jgi:hypothetical protein